MVDRRMALRFTRSEWRGHPREDMARDNVNVGTPQSPHPTGAAGRAAHRPRTTASASATPKVITNKARKAAYESTRLPPTVGPLPRLAIAPARRPRYSPSRLETWGIDGASQRSQHTDSQFLTPAQTGESVRVTGDIPCAAHPSVHSVEDWRA